MNRPRHEVAHLMTRLDMVPWFMELIKRFGGEYEPYRDLTEPKQHTSGRREIRAELEELALERAMRRQA